MDNLIGHQMSTTMKKEKQTEPVTWEERIEERIEEAKLHDEEANANNVAKLHDDRFKLWTTFIDSFCLESVYYEGDEILRRKRLKPLSKRVCLRKTSPTTPDFENQVVSLGHTWAQITLTDNTGVEKCKFDADFGSLDEYSDLDVNVLSTDTDVIKSWIAFLIREEKEGTTFSAYWDSNFYFEPAIAVNGTLVSRSKHVLEDEKDKLVPNRENIVFAMDTIVTYVEAYMNGEGITLEREEDKVQSFTVYPNPTSKNFRHEEEIQQYNAMEYFGNKCLLQELTMERYMNFGCTKPEALLSIMSLAISGVFGEQMENSLRTQKYGFVDDTSWRLITALEMLYNLKMHMHGDDVKTKYMKRLNGTLLQSDFICTIQTQKQRRERHMRQTMYGSLGKNALKTQKIEEILGTINILILDELNGKKCSDEVKKMDIDGNIFKIKEAIRQRSTIENPKEESKSHGSRSAAGTANRGEVESDLQSTAFYHQFIDIMDSEREIF